MIVPWHFCSSFWQFWAKFQAFNNLSSNILCTAVPGQCACDCRTSKCGTVVRKVRNSPEAITQSSFSSIWTGKSFDIFLGEFSTQLAEGSAVTSVELERFRTLESQRLKLGDFRTFSQTKQLHVATICTSAFFPFLEISRLWNSIGQNFTEDPCSTNSGSKAVLNRSTQSKMDHTWQILLFFFQISRSKPQRRPQQSELID